MATKKQLVLRWIMNDQANAADAILELADSLPTGLKTALKNRIVNDLKARNARARAEYADDDADNLGL